MSSKSYSFYKKNRKGKVIKLVKEKYLSSDLGYGSLHGRVLSESNLIDLASSSLNSHVLIVDTNICLHDIDVLEFQFSKHPVIVILQTVLQEIKNLNVACFRRILSLINDENKHFVFYANELSVDTHTERIDSESSNDFNDRQIRESALYFNSFLSTSKTAVSTGITTILISNDKDNKVLSLNECDENICLIHCSFVVSLA